MLQIRQTSAWQQQQLGKPHHLESVRSNYIQTEQHYNERQNPSSEQLVHLAMAG
jgi:hypothetical protein